MAGFCLLAGGAVVLFAGVLLLPELADLQRLEHEKTCRALRVKEAEKTRDAYDRLLASAPEDEVLTSRLIYSRFGHLPSNEAVILTGNASVNPVSLPEIHYENPPAPDTWITQLAQKAEARRRGLLAMAACMTLAAFLIFGPPKPHNKDDQPRKLPPPSSPSTTDTERTKLLRSRVGSPADEQDRLGVTDGTGDVETCCPPAANETHPRH